MVGYFWDSYAIFELINGNSNYARFSQEQITISVFNLVEVYYSFLREYGEEKADELFDQLKEDTIDIDHRILKEAAKFRRDNKKRDLSYADCIGYIYAKRHKMKFLTGDKEFQNLENVEFVK